MKKRKPKQLTEWVVLELTWCYDLFFGAKLIYACEKCWEERKAIFKRLMVINQNLHHLHRKSDNLSSPLELSDSYVS